MSGNTVFPFCEANQRWDDWRLMVVVKLSFKPSSQCLSSISTAGLQPNASLKPFPLSSPLPAPSKSFLSSASLCPLQPSIFAHATLAQKTVSAVPIIVSPIMITILAGRLVLRHNSLNCDLPARSEGLVFALASGFGFWLANRRGAKVVER